MTKNFERIMYRTEESMIVLKKQKAIIESEAGASLTIYFKKIELAVDVETVEWKDKQTKEEGKGKTILRHLGTIHKGRLIKSTKHKNTCIVTLTRGCIMESKHFKDEYVLKHSTIIFRK